MLYIGKLIIRELKNGYRIVHGERVLTLVVKINNYTVKVTTF